MIQIHELVCLISSTKLSSAHCRRQKRGNPRSARSVSRRQPQPRSWRNCRGHGSQDGPQRGGQREAELRQRPRAA